MGDKLLSIVIPAYNMQDYLRRAVDSLIDGQVMDDIEIVVVNDGSTDATTAIAHWYEGNYPGNVVVIDKENGHYGSAVNAGIQAATGKYLKVLDADDWFDTREFVKYVRQLSCIETVDAVFTHWTFRDAGTRQSVHSQRHDNPYNVKMQVDSLTLDFGRYCCYCLYGLTYRTRFLKDIGYRQTEGVCYTDMEFVYYPMMKAETVSFIDAEVYQYCMGREGQSVNPSVMQKNVSHYHKILNRLIATYVPPSSGTRERIQRHVFDYVATPFFLYCLSYNSSENARKYNPRMMDERIKAVSPDIYHMLGRATYHKIPYVRLWRACGFRIECVREFVSFLKRLRGRCG